MKLKNLHDKGEPEMGAEIEIPGLAIKTSKFRNSFPTDTDFYDFLDSRRAAMELSNDSLAAQLSSTVERCPECGGYNPMSNFIQIVYVEEKDDFFGCPQCFLQQLNQHSNKVGKICL
jgi:hypothetical protein